MCSAYVVCVCVVNSLRNIILISNNTNNITQSRFFPKYRDKIAHRDKIAASLVVSISIEILVLSNSQELLGSGLRLF